MRSAKKKICGHKKVLFKWRLIVFEPAGQINTKIPIKDGMWEEVGALVTLLHSRNSQALP